jgi:hypothetical protein
MESAPKGDYTQSRIQIIHGCDYPIVEHFNICDVMHLPGPIYCPADTEVRQGSEYKRLYEVVSHKLSS